MSGQKTHGPILAAFRSICRTTFGGKWLSGWLSGTRLAGVTLAAALVATAAPALAEDAPAAAWEVPDLTLADEALPDLSLSEEVRRDLPERRSPLVKLRFGAAPVGVAVEVSEGVHLGAAGDFDPESGDGVALFALRLSL